MQKPNNLYMEAQRYWSQICDEEYDFDSRQQRIDSYKAVTVDDITALYKQLVFDNARRLNMKVYSQESQQQDRSEEIKLNQKFYEECGLAEETIDDVSRFQMTHELHARL